MNFYFQTLTSVLITQTYVVTVRVITCLEVSCVNVIMDSNRMQPNNPVKVCFYVHIDAVKLRIPLNVSQRVVLSVSVSVSFLFALDPGDCDKP